MLQVVDTLRICSVSQVMLVPTVEHDHQFEKNTSAKFLSDLSSHIQHKCKNATISDLMTIGGACHGVISEFPFIFLSLEC